MKQTLSVQEEYQERRKNSLLLTSDFKEGNNIVDFWNLIIARGSLCHLEVQLNKEIWTHYFSQSSPEKQN